MERKASCSCGQLSICINGDPQMVVACNCLECQSRTGSVLGVSSYFEDGQIIETSGRHNNYKTSNDSGRTIERSFCPDCGSTVFWKAEMLESKTGVAVGCFKDSEFPEPKATVWTSSKHSWVCYPENWPSSETQEFDKS